MVKTLVTVRLRYDVIPGDFTMATDGLGNL
jgi:hypothetical protein